jgi:DNA repair protein RecN (Recombination protein N)
MLSEIRITGLGVIEDATLELDPGFTAVTGETGAGKTMVVTGVNLLLGGRADSGLVRHGVRRARVEGRASGVPRSIVQQAEDRGGELDDDELLIARELSSEGRSRAFLGGASVPVSVLAEVSGDLVAIHGQADQWRLLQPARQRETLDTFAGKAVLVPLGEYATAYRRHREVEAELTELTTRERDRLAEADLLRFGLEEIAKAEPLPGEDVELAAEEERLAYADGLRTAATTAADALASEDLDSSRPGDVLGLLALAKQVLDGEREHDAKLAELADRASELGYLSADLAGELSSYATDVDTDPARLAAVSERRSVLTGLVRKYGADDGTVDEVLDWAKRSAQRLAEIEGSDERVEQLTTERAELQAQLKDLGDQVSAARREAAARLGVAVSEELSGLAMPHANLTVEGDAGARGDPVRHAPGAHAGVRRDRCRDRWTGGRRGRETACQAGGEGPGHCGHTPAAGGRVRGPSRGGAEERRRFGDDERPGRTGRRCPAEGTVADDGRAGELRRSPGPRRGTPRPGCRTSHETTQEEALSECCRASARSSEGTS